MLTRLRVKNYALIEDMDVTFSGGLNILTGQTGAGKSILIGSLNLILGEKASTEMIRSGEEEAFVEASFELLGRIPGRLSSYVCAGEPVLLRRQVIRGGRSYAFVNDHQVTVGKLKEVGNILVDLLGQHHHQSLLNVENHQHLLDRFTVDGDLLRQYTDLFSELRERQGMLESVVSADQLTKERQELYRFQLQEINVAGLEPGEKSSLEEKVTILKNAQKLKETTRELSYSLSEDDDSTLNRLRGMLKVFESIAELDSSLKEKAVQWKESIYSLEDIALELSRYGDTIDADPEQFRRVDERLQLYRDFSRKYGEGYDGIMSYRGKIAGELDSLENRDEKIKELEEEITLLKSNVLNLGQKLSAQRTSGAKRLKKKIEAELAELGMKGTQFDVALTSVSGNAGVAVTNDDDPCLAGEFGLEDIEFLISPNPGEPLKPLAKIASGGEMSRIMLGLKTVLAKVDAIPLLVFDEIDVGIGGDTANLVGKKLKALVQNHQVISITHLQQIASFADRHFQVRKAERGGRTVTEVAELSQEERVAEIARMISGEKITDLTLEHAREFLRGAAEA
ncbi:MAG: DNA repair protein RecN [Candidatus Neomarinimicrobiota bacterium]|nr:DNA repair protein RecN [Candidatus Neomarinimicrobiota bacterium]